MTYLEDSIDGLIAVEINLDDVDVNDYVAQQMEIPGLETQPVDFVMKNAIHEWTFKDYSREDY